QGGLVCRRLVRAGHRAAARRYQPTGTTLVTGGTEGFGPHVARWLARLGAPHLLLTGDPGAAGDLVAELEGGGCRVTVAVCDLPSRDALAALLAEHDVRGIFHLAGRGLDARPLTETGLDDLQRGLGDSALAAVHLDELTAGRELEAFALFSSI